VVKIVNKQIVAGPLVLLQSACSLQVCSGTQLGAVAARIARETARWWRGGRSTARISGELYKLQVLRHVQG